jgi:hypothetical protein
VDFTGRAITLDGSKSTDPDGDALSYSWSFISRPTGSSPALSDPTEISPTFTPDLDGTYVIQLIVNDGKVDSEPDICIITAAANAQIIVSTNESSYSAGDTLELYVNVINPDPAFSAELDAFIGLGLPDGILYFFDSSLNLLPSNTLDPRTFTPFLTNIHLPTSFTFPAASQANVDTDGDGASDSYRLFSAILPQLAPGNYFAFAVLAEPGSVQSGSPRIIGDISISSILVP